ncbi:MAG: hypothetical protein KC621_22480 [Myxococcales bacterium]|nr:hypothetical protein [Myxococcales bacterium]
MATSYEAIDALVARLGKASWKERDPIKAELEALAATFPDRKAVLDHLEQAKRTIGDLEARWEVDEVIEKLTPPPVAAEPEEEQVEDPNRPLTAADLNVVYDDPRGFMLHKTKVGERWFATQVDPRSGQPQTFELRPEEVTQLKQQLQGSPYWLLGAGA